MEAPCLVLCATISGAPQSDGPHRRLRAKIPFTLNGRRIHEMARLIELRHGRCIPETEDSDHYVWSVAQHLLARGVVQMEP